MGEPITSSSKLLQYAEACDAFYQHALWIGAYRGKTADEWRDEVNRVFLALDDMWWIPPYRGCLPWLGGQEWLSDHVP